MNQRGFTRRVLRALVLLFGLISLVCASAQADVFRPAYLELTELGGDRYEVLWKVPAQSEQVALALDVVFPKGTTSVDTPRSAFTGDTLIKRWRIERPGGLIGQAIRIKGKAARATDVIARVERRDGTSQVERLAIERPSFIVQAPAGTSEIAWSYLVLGVEHILGGVDHLLFVLALLLIVRGGRRIFATITAFTLAHSITLGAATLGFVRVPGPPVEAIIALSIVFVAAEVVHERLGRPGITSRVPWLVAFTFGLLHGFGFAGALAEVGLPQKSIPMALLTFNVGVELGQLAFVGAVIAVVVAYRRFVSTRPWAGRIPPRAALIAPYAIGSMAAFWLFVRVAAFWE